MRWPESIRPGRDLRRTPEAALDLLGLGVALSLLGDTALYVVLPTHPAQAGVLLADVGLMLSANRAIRILLNSPYGVWIERLPRRRVLVPSQLLGMISTLLYAVPGFWPLLIGRLLWGIAWMGIWLGGSTAVLDIATNSNRGRFVGRFQMWGFIGLGAGALLGGTLVDAFGYQPAFLMLAAAGLLAALVWAWFLPETRPPADRPHPVSSASPEALPASRLPLVTAALVMGLNWLIFLGMIGALLPLLVQERVGEPNVLLLPLATLTGIVAAISQALSLVAAPASGWLSDRGRSRWRLIVLALALGVGALLLAAVGDAPAAILGVLLAAVATGVLQTQAITLAGDYIRASRSGRMMGVLNTAGDLGSAAGPVLSFALLPALGLAGIFGLAALALLLVLPAVAWVGWRERNRPPAAT